MKKVPRNMNNVMFKKGRAVVIRKPKEVELEKILLPPITDESIVIHTRYSGISTGTSLNIYNGYTPPLEGSLWYPVIPGYEEVGEVAWVGKKVKEFKVGDRVMGNNIPHGYPTPYCGFQGGEVEYAVIGPHTAGLPKDRCPQIPKEVSYPEAVIVRLIAVAQAGLRRVKIKQGDTVLIIGQGVVGMGAAQLAKMEGAKVIVADLYENRLKVSKKFANYTVNSLKEDLFTAVKEITNGKMADIVFESSGNSKMVANAVIFGKAGFQIVLTGYYPEPIIISKYHQWMEKRPTLAISTGWTVQGMEKLLQLVAKGRLKVKEILRLSPERPIQEVAGAYKELNENRDKYLKVIFKWD